MDPVITPEQADFILDWLASDPGDAAAAAEVVNANGKTVYQEAGDADAETFINNLIDALEPLATPVDEEEATPEDATV